MMKISRSRLLGLLSTACALAFCATASAEPMTYHIHVDTSTLVGTTGNLEFVLNAGLTGPVDFMTATFYNFTTDGGPFATVPPDFGDVVGSLPGPLTLDNAGPGADHAESITFGSFFDVFVDVDVPSITPGAGSGSTLGLNVEDNNFSSLLTAPGEFLVLIATDAGGNQSIINNNSLAADVQPVPEPASLLLLGSILLGLLGCARRKRQRG